MPLKIIPNPRAEISFQPQVADSPTKPVGLVVDTLNNYHVEHHRGARHTIDNYFIHVSDLIRASTVWRFCSREHALTVIEDRGESRVKQIPPGMRLLHSIGHAVQSHVTNDFINRSQHRDKVWGNWRCVCGHTGVSYQFRPQPGACTCTKCGQDPVVYAEILITWPEYYISGHPDLIIVWGGKIHIYEIKSIDRKDIDFATMAAPLGDHTLQGSMYYWIMKDMYDRDLLDHDVDPFVNYIYADRSNNLFKRDFYKEFTKRVSPYSRVEPMLANAKSVRDSLTQMILPNRLDLCKGVSSPRAKNCDCAVSCFARKRNVIHGRNV